MLAAISSVIVWIAESSLGKAILQYVWDDLSSYLSGIVAKHKAALAAQAAATASIQKLQSAQSAQEIDDASDDALDGV